VPVRVVTDSTGDLPAELAARENILVVPAVLNLGGRSYRDGVDITRAEFYRQLPTANPLPTTSAPAAGDFEACFRQCGSEPIVCIVLASKLSAMYNAARLGAEGLGEQVTLVDSGNASMALGWQALTAAEAANRGASRDEVLAAARDAQRRVRLFAALDTVEYLRRGGRASAFSAMVGELLQIKPLLEVRDGEVIPLARVRTRGKVREALAEQVERLGRLQRLAVLHAAEPAGAEAMAARLAPLSAEPPVIIEATSVLGTHVGPGTLGLAPVLAA
jgi:DegV family protein with EDD domain